MIGGNTKKIGVLCAWYKRNGPVLEIDKQFNHGYYDISHYQITIPMPNFVNGHLCLQNHVINELEHRKISF